MACCTSLSVFLRNLLSEWYNMNPSLIFRARLLLKYTVTQLYITVHLFSEQRHYVHLSITKIASHTHLQTSTPRTLISPQPTDIPLLQMKDGKGLFPPTSNILMLLICLRFGSGKNCKSASSETPNAPILWPNTTSERVKQARMIFSTDICNFHMQVWTFLVKHFEIHTLSCATDYSKWPTLSQWLEWKSNKQMIGTNCDENSGCFGWVVSTSAFPYPDKLQLLGSIM